MCCHSLSRRDAGPKMLCIMLSWHKCGVDRCSAPFSTLGRCATSHFWSPARAHIAPAMKTASRQQYRTLPIFGSFIDDFAAWLRHRGLSSSKVRQHLASLQRLAPWFLRKQKRSPDDLSVDDINDAQRLYRLRVPSLAAVIAALGEFYRPADD
jgi:hypothetical protein